MVRSGTVGLLRLSGWAQILLALALLVLVTATRATLVSGALRTTDAAGQALGAACEALKGASRIAQAGADEAPNVQAAMQEYAVFIRSELETAEKTAPALLDCGRLLGGLGDTVVDFGQAIVEYGMFDRIKQQGRPIVKNGQNLSRVGSGIVKGVEGFQQTGLPALKKTAQILDAAAAVDIGGPAAKARDALTHAIQGTESARQAVSAMTWAVNLVTVICYAAVLAVLVNGCCLLSLARVMGRPAEAIGTQV